MWPGSCIRIVKYTTFIANESTWARGNSRYRSVPSARPRFPRSSDWYALSESIPFTIADAWPPGCLAWSQSPSDGSSGCCTTAGSSAWRCPLHRFSSSATGAAVRRSCTTPCARIRSSPSSTPTRACSPTSSSAADGCSGHSCDGSSPAPGRRTTPRSRRNCPRKKRSRWATWDHTASTTSGISRATGKRCTGNM